MVYVAEHTFEARFNLERESRMVDLVKHDHHFIAHTKLPMTLANYSKSLNLT